MKVSDFDLNEMFFGTRFGGEVDNSIPGKRRLISKTLQNLVDGFWSGHTAYHIVLNGGFILDGKRGESKKLTKLGRDFLEQYPHKDKS